MPENLKTDQKPFRNEREIFLLHNNRLSRKNHDQLTYMVNNLQTEPKLLYLCDTWLKYNNAVELYKINGYCSVLILKKDNTREADGSHCLRRKTAVEKL